MLKKTLIIAVSLIVSFNSFAGLNSLFYCPDSVTYSSPAKNGYTSRIVLKISNFRHGVANCYPSFSPKTIASNTLNAQS